MSDITEQVRTTVLQGAGRISPAVADALAAALGGADVVAGVSAFDGDLARCMVLCVGGFVMLEMTRGGDQLIVALPVWRIKRVVESRVGGVTRVTVELDADRTVTTAQLDATTVTTPAAYEVVQPVGLDEDVRTFASAMRDALLAG
jgi:hypothetical protein